MEVKEKLTIDQIEPMTRKLTQQTSSNQMSSLVSIVESLSRPILTKKIPEKKRAKCLGSWAYTGPGYENEIIGKIEKGGMVCIISASKDLIWHSIKCNAMEGWVPTTRLDFEVERKVQKQFDSSPVLEKILKLNQERYTISSVGLRTYPNVSSHCQVILNPKTKVTVALQREQWFQVTICLNEKDYK